jgi:hypothetical protein
MMKRSWISIDRLTLVIFLIIQAASAASPSSTLTKTWAGLPLHFEADTGGFVSRGGSLSAAFSSRGARLLVRNGDLGPVTLNLNWLGAKADVKGEGREPLAGRANYLIGKMSDWRRDVTMFSRLHFDALYPGTDLDIYGKDEKL